MSRFTYHIRTDGICELQDNDRPLSSIEVVTLLNHLNDENEQLKKQIKAIQQQNRSMAKFMNDNFDEYMSQKRLSDENEQLKKQLENSLIYEKEDS